MLLDELTDAVQRLVALLNAHADDLDVLDGHLLVYADTLADLLFQVVS